MAVCPYCREILRDEDHFTVHLQSCSLCLYNNSSKSSLRAKEVQATSKNGMNKNNKEIKKAALCKTKFKRRAHSKKSKARKRGTKYQRKRSGKRLIVKRRGNLKRKKSSSDLKYRKKGSPNTKISKQIKIDSKPKQSKIKRSKPKQRPSKSNIIKSKSPKHTAPVSNTKDNFGDFGQKELNTNSGQWKKSKPEDSEYTRDSEFSKPKVSPTQNLKWRTKYIYERNIQNLCEEYQITRKSLLQDKSIYDEVSTQTRNLGNRFTCSINYGRKQLNLKAFKRNQPEENVTKQESEFMGKKNEEKISVHLGSDNPKVSKQTLNQYIKALLLEIEQDIDG